MAHGDTDSEYSCVPQASGICAHRGSARRWDIPGNEVRVWALGCVGSVVWLSFLREEPGLEAVRSSCQRPFQVPPADLPSPPWWEEPVKGLRIL